VARVSRISRALDKELSRLASKAVVAHSGRDRLIIANGGIFVLRAISSDENPSSATREIERLAHLTRDRLAQHSSWVPYVDWFLVGEPRAGYTVLALDLIAPTVLEHDGMDDDVHEELVQLVNDGMIAPTWFRGIPAAWDPAFIPNRGAHSFG